MIDPVQDIKARLPIETLVSQYCAVVKKGRQLLCLCPFHNDSHPSMTISPDKGIAYCFACNSGGDIFSFYQKIERVDFPQALKELAEKVGVELPKEKMSLIPKEGKERLLDVLKKAHQHYQTLLKDSQLANTYLEKRGMTDALREVFEFGYASGEYTELYDFLLKSGYSKTEIIDAGLGIERELQDGRVIDRFRNRLMIPIHDLQGRMIGFGGRTLGDDDAKYINSPETALYHKGSVLFNFHRARESIRSTDTVILVEGYFDVIGVWSCGLKNVVAVSGTALTEEHARILKRSCTTVILALDSDRAGLEAAERTFGILAPLEFSIKTVVFNEKDPADLAKDHPESLVQLFSDNVVPYVEQKISMYRNIQSIEQKKECIQKILPLIEKIPSSIERTHYLQLLAKTLSISSSDLEQDFARLTSKQSKPLLQKKKTSEPIGISSPCSALEMIIALIDHFPSLLSLLNECIDQDTEEYAQLVLPAKSVHLFTDVEYDHSIRERISIVAVFLQNQGFFDWSLVMAEQNVRRMIMQLNREYITKKQHELIVHLQKAELEKDFVQVELLKTQYQSLLTLLKKATK